MASLPRPSRPSLNPPPSAPLPSLPVPKSRSSASGSPGGGIPTPTTPTGFPQRSPSAGLPTGSSSTPTTPAPGQTASAAAAQTGPPAGKTLKKTASYNVFPKTPNNNSRPGSTHSTTSNAPTPRTSKRASSLYNGASNRTSAAATASARTSVGTVTPGSRAVSVAPSLPGDFAESALEDDEPRGRPASTSGGKDKGNVVISVRVRPDAPPSDNDAPPLPVAGEWMVDGKQSLISFKGREGGDYLYDNVFSAHDKNAKVYEQTSKRLVRRVMEGYHGTVFAYGMTGTGKTYSMQGTATSPGVIPLAITDIFSFIRETPQREFLLRVSYLEIYNERIHDLLSAPVGGAPGQGVQQQEEIKIREDSKRGVYATPLKEEIVQSPTQLLRVIARGDHSRRTAGTQFNARSSRSHAVVQIVVESRERNAGGASAPIDKRAPIIPGGVRVSTLSLIDLAGSERAAESKERRTEGAHINKSLLTLGTVISKLSGTKDKNGQPMDKEGKHLPYRDSKLTRLLQPALSGNSLISILCTIQIGANGSAAAQGSHTMETLNTLKFAARARNNITSHAKRAEEAHAGIGDASSRALLDRYRQEILDLRKQLEGQKEENQNKEKPEEKEEEDEKVKEIEQERHDEQMLEMQLARTALKERIDHLNRLILSSKSIGVNSSRPVAGMGGGTQRGSTFSTTSYSKSVRSSAGSALGSTQDLTRNSSTASVTTSGTKRDRSVKDFDQMSTADTVPEGEIPPGGEEDDDDTLGEHGDGTASLASQVKNLQADLADKNRYISTLEKRLLQARRNSRSRVSVTLNRPSSTIPEDEGPDAILKDKDAEIADLRARLDDKDRMIAALKSAARKRDTADSSRPGSALNMSGGDRSSKTSASSSTEQAPVNGVLPRRTSGASTTSNSQQSQHNRRSSVNAPTSSSLSKVTSMSDREGVARTATPPVSAGTRTSPLSTKTISLAGGSPSREVRRNHGVDEMTRMLDEMIRQRVEQGVGGSIAGSKPLPVRPTSMQINREAAANAAAVAEKQHAMTNGDATGSHAQVNGHEPDRKSASGPPSSAAAAHAAIVQAGQPKSPKSPSSPPGLRRNLSADNARLSGWETDVQKRRSIRKESQEGATPQAPTTPTSNGGFPASATGPASPTTPYGYGASDLDGSEQRRSLNVDRAPPMPRRSLDQPRAADRRDQRMLGEHLPGLDRHRDPSPAASDGTAIADEMQEPPAAMRSAVETHS